jgi:hypothetical protein
MSTQFSFKLEVLVQRNEVEEEYKILQVLIDNKMNNTTFTWYPDTETVLFSHDIFQKQKRVKEDIIGEQIQEIIF